jgi:CHAT domain-containing protein/Tfp pilus assembly protein PilF
MRLIIVLAIGLVVSGCTGLRPEPVGGSLEDLRAQAASAYESGRYRDAETGWQRALALADEQRQEVAATGVLIDLARVTEATGRYPEARELASRGLGRARGLKDRALEARALAVLGLVSRRLGEHPVALAYLDRARVIAGELDDPGLKAEAARSSGAAYQALGDYARAEGLYGDSLALARAAGDRLAEAKALNDQGGLHRLRAEYPLALQRYGESLAIRQALGDAPGEAAVTGNLCLVYQNLRDFDAALAHCERALGLARETGSRAVEANVLNNLGGIRRALGDSAEALALYRRSIVLKRALPDPAGEARTLNNVGELYRQLGDGARAAEYLSASLQIKARSGDRAGESATRYNLGLVELDAGRHREAHEQLERALALQAGDGRPELVWRALDGLGRVYAATGQRAHAVFFGKQAVNTIQAVRAGIAELDPSLQRSFLRDKEGVYRRLADRLVEAGRLLEAQQVLAMLKEEEYFEFIRRDARDDPRRTAAVYSKAEGDWRARYEAVKGRLVELGRAYTELQLKALEADLRDAERAREAELAEDLRVARLAFADMLEVIGAEVPPERAEELGEKDLKTLEAFQGTLRQLGGDTVLVHYLVTEDRLRLILTGPDPSTPPVLRASAISRTALNTLIAQLRDKLRTPIQDPLPEARELYRHVIGPVEADLQAYGAKTLMVYLDQALRYLPLAALHDGERYLAERYALAAYTVAAKGSLLEPPARPWRVAALGTSQGGDGFAPLPAVPLELDAIVKEGEADTHGVWPGRTFLDAAFTAERLRAVLYARFRVIHLSTHFRFSPGTERDSFLLTGDRAHLTLEDLRTRGFPFTDVDLLTLSACETAVGEADADGREVEGLGALAQDRGAKAVLATLWEVADRSTADFMEQFYQRQQAGLTKAEALRQTQLAFLGGEVASAVAGTPEEGRGRVLSAAAAYVPPPGYRHPYYWAPFILMGNWR